MRLKRLLAFFLSVVLFIACFASLTGAEEVPETTGTEEISGVISDEEIEDFVRFGGAAVSRDEEGKVTAVNGFPVRSVRAGFNSVGHKISFQHKADFME